MKKLTMKFLFVVASVLHPKIKRDYRYFIRDNYFSRLLQIKYFFKDYVSKKKYKVIEFQGEFDQELRYVIPFAYWHHLNGTLKTTISSKNTKEFYFFSNSHVESHTKRIWELGYSNFEIPNMTHNINFTYKKWVKVPFKSQYSNDIFVYNKPLLIIANKFNIEWDNQPINFFSKETLSQIITIFQDEYQIIYNRPLSTQIVTDNSEILDLDEHQWLKNIFPTVIQMQDLYEAHQDKVNNFNHLQLLVYANCSKFISVHGGTAAFASYFGGINIILSKRGIEHELNEFNTIFPALSDAEILHAKSEVELIRISKSKFLT